jgi:hypothetical protein
MNINHAKQTVSVAIKNGWISYPKEPDNLGAGTARGYSKEEALLARRRATRECMRRARAKARLAKAA